MSPSVRQQELLTQPPDPRAIAEKDGFSYIPHHYIRVSLTRIFGWGHWSFNVTATDLLNEGKRTTKNNRELWVATYRVTGRLSVIYDDDRQSNFTESAVDSGMNPLYEQAHDNAVKGAASMALRRCAMNLGSVFGLGLYFNGHTGEVVGRTIDTPEVAA